MVLPQKLWNDLFSNKKKEAYQNYTAESSKTKEKNI